MVRARPPFIAPYPEAFITSSEHPTYNAMASSRRICSRRFLASTAHLLKYSRHSYSTVPHYPPEINQLSHSPSTADIAEDDVSRLAANPMRQLTLADLVR